MKKLIFLILYLLMIFPVNGSTLILKINTTDNSLENYFAAKDLRPYQISSGALIPAYDSYVNVVFSDNKKEYPMWPDGTVLVEDAELVERVEFYSNGVKKFSERINYCNYNEICEPCIKKNCDVSENFLVCDDCSLQEKDNLCHPKKDNICDPDCTTNDPDCAEEESPKYKITVEDYSSGEIEKQNVEESSFLDYKLIILAVILIAGIIFGLYYIEKTKLIVISLIPIFLFAIFLTGLNTNENKITGYAGLEIPETPLNCPIDYNLHYFSVEDFTGGAFDRYYSHCITNAQYDNHDYMPGYLIEAFETYPNLIEAGYTPLLLMTQCYVESSHGSKDGCNQEIPGGMCQVVSCPDSYPDCRKQENIPSAIHDNLLSAAGIISSKIKYVLPLKEQFGLTDRQFLELVFFAYNRGQGTVVGGIDYGEGRINTGWVGYMRAGNGFYDSMKKACYQLYNWGVYGTCFGSRDACCQGSLDYVQGIIGEYEGQVCPGVTRLGEPPEPGETPTRDRDIPEEIIKNKVAGYYYLTPNSKANAKFDLGIYEIISSNAQSFLDEIDDCDDCGCVEPYIPIDWSAECINDSKLIQVGYITDYETYEQNITIKFALDWSRE